MRQWCRGALSGDTPQDALQVLDVALKHSPSLRENCLSTPAALFLDEPQSLRPIGDGAQVIAAVLAHLHADSRSLLQKLTAA